MNPPDTIKKSTSGKNGVDSTSVAPAAPGASTIIEKVKACVEDHPVTTVMVCFAAGLGCAALAVVALTQGAEQQVPTRLETVRNTADQLLQSLQRFRDRVTSQFS